MEVNCPPVVPFDRSNPKRQRCHSDAYALKKEGTPQEYVVKAKSSSSKASSFRIFDMKVGLVTSEYAFHFDSPVARLLARCNTNSCKNFVVANSQSSLPNQKHLAHADSS